MTIGQTLAEARRERRLSVEQISDRTRIRRTVVAAMERDDFSHCGGDFYARAHLRNIAAVLEIDPAPLLAEYDREHGETAGPSASEVFESETRARPERQGLNWTAAMAVALVLVLGFGAYRLFIADDGGSSPTTSVAGPTASPRPSTAPSPSAITPSGKPSAPPQVAQVPNSGVTVVMTAATGVSWVTVKNDAGSVVFEGLLRKGQSKTLTDRKRLRLTVGNAAAVQLVVNGKSIGSPGGQGEVARVTFGPGDPAAG